MENLRLSFKYLDELLIENDKVVIGVSGGPDSMALLNLLLDIKNKKKIEIIVCHVNHNVRVEAKEEEEFVNNYCLNKQVIVENCSLEVIEKNFEAEARKKRYEFFKNIASKYSAKYIMTAHHQDDLIETILMKIIRGSNMHGYRGFDIESQIENYILVRPLIYYSKDDILRYLNDNNIEYRIDKSNYECNHLRNRIRHEIVPKLKNENKNIGDKFYEYHNNLKEMDDFIERYSCQVMTNIYTNSILDIGRFIEEDIVIKKKILELIFKEIYKDDLYLIRSSNSLEIIKLCQSKKPNGEVELPNMYIFVKAYNKGYVKKKEDIRQEKTKLVEYYEVYDQRIEIVDECDDTSNNVTRLLSTEIKLPLYIRKRKDGDRLEVKNMKGSKKLKSILIDEKIKKEDRDKLFVVVDSEDKILFIPGVKKTKFDKDKNKKYDIILKYTKGERKI